MAIEEPAYTTIATEGDFEIRAYAPVLVAETWAEGDMDEASSKGFRLIADYIFGNNLSDNVAGTAKIAMTAPVTVQPTSSKIAMTAPVTVAPTTQGVDMQSAKAWRIQFVMPSQYTMATIPKPKNPAVTLREMPSKYVVVLTYSGFNFLSRVQTKTDETTAWVQANGLTAVGLPQLARYNPPWTLPMFRRNEIMLEIAQPPASTAPPKTVAKPT